MNDSKASPSSAEARNGQAGSLSDRVRSLRLPTRPVHQPGRTTKLPWVLCLALLATAGYLGYRMHQAEQALASGADGAEPGTNASADSSSASSSSANGSRAPASRYMETGGYLIPVRRVQVSPKVGGQVLQMFFEEGDRVKQGQELARIDPTRYEFVKREREAQAAMLKAEWEKLKVSLAIEEKVREAAVSEGEAQLARLRDKRTFLINARAAVPQEELNDMSFQVEQASEKLNQLKRNLQLTRDTTEKELERAWGSYQQAEASADSARYDVDNCTVHAPTDGIVLKKYAEEGNMVRPEAFSNGLSASLYDMADLMLLEVDVDISERDLEFVFAKQRCEIRTEAFPDRIYKGYVSRLMPEANRSKACVSARVRVEVPPGDTYLRPEMRARVRFFAPDPETPRQNALPQKTEK